MVARVSLSKIILVCLACEAGHAQRCPPDWVAANTGGCYRIVANGAGANDPAVWVGNIERQGLHPASTDSASCTAAMCGDYGNDCCAPGQEPRGCQNPEYIVSPGGHSSYEPCESSFGKDAVYQCCKSAGGQFADCPALCAAATPTNSRATGVLASISSSAQLEEVQALLLAEPNLQRPYSDFTGAPPFVWIGLYKGQDDEWKWSDGTILSPDVKIRTPGQSRAITESFDVVDHNHDNVIDRFVDLTPWLRHQNP